MRPSPSAIGFLRRDVSGVRQPWHEIHLRSLAKRYGYNLRKTLTFGRATEDLVDRLYETVTRLEVDAVFTPSLGHFDGQVPSQLVRVVHIITVLDEQTFARWAAGQLPQEL